jgi:hypothetical protein
MRVVAQRVFRHARRVLIRCLGVALAIALALPRLAHAQENPCVPRDRFSTCIASDNLWPHPGGDRFVSQAPTQLPAEGAITFGLVPTFYLRPIGFEVASPDPDGSTVFGVDRALAGHFLLAIAPADRLQLSLVVPAILYQDGAGKSDIVGSEEDLPRSALGDMRFGAYYAFFSRDGDGPGLSGRFEMAAPIANEQAFAGYRSATWSPGLAFDYRLGRVLVGADVGARLRQPSRLGGATLGHQLSASLGVGVDILADGWLSAGAELWALFTLHKQEEIVRAPGGRDTQVEAAPPHIPMEWLATVRTAGFFEGQLRMLAGAGTLIPTAEHTAVTSPAFRAVLGVQAIYE